MVVLAMLLLEVLKGEGCSDGRGGVGAHVGRRLMS